MRLNLTYLLLVCVAGIANLLSDHGSEQPKKLVTRLLGGIQCID